MIKTVKCAKCAKCRKEPRIHELIDIQTRIRTGWKYECHTCGADARGRTVRQATRRWNWRQWRARRKCGTCRYGKDRNDNGLSVECRCIISPKYRLAMSAEKHHCWAWLEGRKMKGEKKA